VIHPTAIVDPKAEIAPDVEIGPYSIVGPKVKIDSGTWIGPHVVINGRTTIGKNNRIYQFASIGEGPQDKKYADEDTALIIGDDNRIRESVTIHRGTIQDKGLTQIGSRNLFMAYVHVAHDCVLGNDIVCANTATLAGHVLIGDHVIISAFCAIHQFVQVGAHAFISHAAMVTKDVPPFVMLVGNGGSNLSVCGLNSEGLKRRGFTSDQIELLKKAYKVVYREGLRVVDAIEQLKVLEQEDHVVKSFREFLEHSTRGIVR
jgi:UDP-N-acetylglucosamine acyltransferase